MRRRAPGVLMRRLSGALTTLVRCGVARHAADNVIELVVNDEEAAEGGMASISMYVPVRCPACVDDPRGACARCDATRVVDELFSAWLAVPPDVTDGTMLAPSALLPGMRPVGFRVRRSA